MKIYHNPRCSKSRQTLNLIEENGKEVGVIKYLDTPPKESELKEIIAMLGIAPQDLIRKGEKIYKENFKGKEYNNEEWIKIMVKNPILIERPIVVENGKAIIGRPPEKVLELL